MRVFSAWLIASLSLAIGLPLAASDGFAPSDDQVRFFEQKIRPVLVTHCYECHSAKAKKVEGGLLLDSRAGLRKGGDSGPVIVPGDVAKSLLIAAIRHVDDGPQMPPKGKLPNETIADFEKWVALGAPDPRIGQEMPVRPAAGDHWAFQPIDRPELPAVRDAAWPLNSIDAFVLSRLEAAGLAPSADADCRTLIRRLSFDLIGVPPQTTEIDDFIADKSALAYEQLVDRLLNSPHFGERWARHWLDVARYADTKGYLFEEDRKYAGAYKYRDWVVQSLNGDLPFDQFLLQQLAADQMPDGQRRSEAMGFLTLGRRFLNNSHDIIDDRIDVICRGLLGLTVTCARCHGHKYDPVTMDDYYALYGVLASSQEQTDDGLPPRLADRSQPHDARVFLRGNPGNPGPVVPRRFLAALSNGDPKPFAHGSGRWELAQAIVAAQNPLTARVFVNRVWGRLIGKGLVRTPSDFGTRSEPPSHPELLDHLARGFIDEGWSVKTLIRRIVLSRSYRQQSQERLEAQSIDAENVLLWKMNRRRLDFEATRDGLLAASGQLDRTLGGPAVDITTEPFSRRRTIYGFIDRQNLPSLFRTFDFASPDTHSPQRFETTVPQQSLFLLNDPFVIEQAIHLAGQTEVSPETPSGDRTRERVARLFRAVYGRGPDDEEITSASALVDGGSTTDDEPADSVWQYGFGSFAPASQRIEAFHRLTHWTGSQWQGGAQLPDAHFGWVLLHANGGHPGNDAQHTAIRRWIAPCDGVLKVRGRLVHPSEQGDGVRGIVVSSRSGVASQWIIQHRESETNVDRIDVRRSDTIDFVTECRANPNCDSFQWTIELSLEAADRTRNRWNSAADFRGDDSRRLDPWQRLAHVLLISNESQFVD